MPVVDGCRCMDCVADRQRRLYATFPTPTEVGINGGFTVHTDANTAPIPNGLPTLEQVYVQTGSSMPEFVRCSYRGNCSRRNANNYLISGSIAYGCSNCGLYYCQEHHHDNPTGRATQYCAIHATYHATCIEVRRCPSCSMQHCEVPYCDYCFDYHCGVCAVNSNRPGYYGDYRGVLLTFPESDKHRMAQGNRHIGFEIECEYGKTFDLPRGFGITRDGSLDNGIEVLTPPAMGSHLVDTVTQAMSVLRESGWEVSSRCGLHTHIDLRDKRYDMRFLARLFTLGFAFEELLYNLQREDRHDNTYSIPLRHEYGFNAGRGNVAADFEFMYEKVDKKERWARMRLREGRRDKYAGQRYMGFNFHSVFHRGSLEVRVHEGTLDENRALGWADILQKIVERAERRLSYKALLKYMEIDLKEDAITQAGELLGLSDDNLSYLDQFHRWNDQYVHLPYELEHPRSSYENYY